MKRCNALSQLLLGLVAFCIAAATGSAQVQLNAVNTPVTIDFTGYTASGFAPAPTSGQLNSNSWASTGMSDGALSFGGTQTAGDYARGEWVTGTTSGGFYYINSGGNTRFVIQPTGADWNPGTLTLRVQNTTGRTLTRLAVGYDLFVNNSGPRANAFNFSYSTDGTNFTSVGGNCGGNYTSPEAADGAGFVLGASKSLSITGLNVANGNFIYLRWNGADVTGSGNRDQFGLDNIVVTSVHSVNTAIAVSNYTFNSSATAISNPTTDLGTVAHAALVDDAVSNAITLPFTFFFNGKPYDRIAISSNGWVALGNSSNNPVFPATMGSAPLNDPEAWQFDNTQLVAPLWDNLRTGVNGAVSYATVGNTFKVRWRSMEWPATAVSFITFELTLDQSCNAITFSYTNGSNSALQSATVGLINDADNAAPNNYWVFNGNVAAGNLTNNANSNANTRLISFNNLPSGGTPAITANHYEALRIEGNATVNLGNVDANGGTANTDITIRNLGCNAVTLTQGNVVYSNAQFTSPAFSATIAPGATATAPIRFTGVCPFDACPLEATMALSIPFGGGTLPVVYPAGASLTVLGQETHPMVAAGTLAAFPVTTLGTSNSVTVTLTNGGNVDYTGTLNISGNVDDAALFTITPNPVTIAANGSTVVTVKFTPNGARHVANANVSTWIANYAGLALVVPQGNQTCNGANLASLPISASSTAPRVSINVSNSTEITNNQGIPTLDIGNRAYTPTPGTPDQPLAYSETFLVKNTGSAEVTINDIVRGATGNLNGRFVASAVRISGNAKLLPGNEAVYRVTYTPEKTTSDFPYFEPTVYTATPGAGAFVTANSTYAVNTLLSGATGSSAVVPAVAGFWHNYKNGAASTFAPSENLTQNGTINATADIFRGFMRTVAAPASTSNQGPTNAAGAPVLASGALMVNGAAAVNVGTAPNGLTVTSYYGAVGDVLPNGAAITNAGQPGTTSFYVVNTGTANARYYVRKTVVNDDTNPGAFSISVPIPGDNANSANSLIPVSSETINGVDYHVFTLEPLYLQGAAGNSRAYVRFDVTFRPNRSNTPDITTIGQNRAADIEILTDANLPSTATASVEPRNDRAPYYIHITGQTLFNDPAFFIGSDQITTTVDFGSHELADATSSNYPFGSFYPAGVGYFAPADELGRRGLTVGAVGPKAFGVRDTVITIAIENRGNAPMVFNNMTDLQAFALSGSPGTFSVVKVTTQTNINNAGNGEPAAATFPFTLNANGQRIIMWVRYDAGARTTGAVGLSNGTIRLVQSPLANPAVSTVSLSGSVMGRGIRPFPIVNIDGGAATTMIIDGTERVAPVHRAARPAIFDNYCGLGGVQVNRDTVRIPLTIGNGIPAPTQAGGSLAQDNVNDNAVTDVTFNMNNVVVDSLLNSGIIIPGASTSFILDYSSPVVIRNSFGTVVRTQDISNAADRNVTVSGGQTMTFTVLLRPTTLSATPNSLKARVRVAHSSRNNSVDFRNDAGQSQTHNSNPSEFGDVYKWMDLVVEGSSLRPGLRLEAGNNGAMMGNYIAPNATINDFNLPYPYLPGVFVGDSSYTALTLRNSQVTTVGTDVSTGKIGIKSITIEGVDFPDFEIVGFNLPTSTVEPNPIAFPVAAGANNGSSILVSGKSFVQWVASFSGSEIGSPYILDRNAVGQGEVSLYVHFKPRRLVNGANKDIRRAILRVVTTDLCSPEIVYNLEARALNSELTLSTHTIDFGNVQVNDVAQQTITITNNGNSPAFFNTATVPFVFPSSALYSHDFSLFPLGFSLFSTHPPHNFSLIGDITTPLNPGDSRTIGIEFAPSQNGRKDATMHITYIPEVPPTLSNGNIEQVELIGRGVAPVTLTTDPASGILNFGNVVVGTTKTMPITLTNTGAASLRLELPAATMGKFSHNMGNATSVVIDGGKSITIEFTYAPTAFGNDEETFVITVPNGFGTSSISIVTRGAGASGAALSASDITFPITRVFTRNTENLFVNNSSNPNASTVVFNGISGVNSNEFELHMNGAPVQIGATFSIPAGANSSNMEVVFAPNQLPATSGSINIRNAELNFTVNGVVVSVAVKGEGAIPQVAFVSSDIVNGELDFGSISGTGQRSVRVYNVGRFPLNVTQLLLMGEDAGRFELANIQDVVLDANEWIEVRITLVCGGTTSTVSDARLTAVSNSLQSRSVELRGACAIPQIGISATNLAFGRVELGKSVEKTLIIRSATGQPLTVTGLMVDGTNRSDFAIASTSKQLPATVSGSEEFVAIVRFAPNAEGAKEARVRVASTVGQTEVAVDGSAVVPGTVVLNQQSLNFGSLPVGKSRELAVVITNHAAVPVAITSVAVEGDDRAMFSADATGAFTLQPTESRTVNVVFTPTDNGSKFALLRFMTASGTQPVAALMGKGGSAKISVANVADFGSVNANEFREMEIAVTSTGDETLVLNNAYVSGPSREEFSVVTAMPVSIESGKTVNVKVRFMPKEGGNKVAYLNLLNNSGNAGTVELRGNSITTGVTGEPVSVAFGITQTYPNPFNEMTTVAYTLSARSNVVVRVFDQLGEEVATLVNGVQEGGNHTATFKAGILPAGSYVVRLEAGDQVATQKITLVK